MNNRREEVILNYLELTYGKSDLYEDEEKIGINGVCIYFKKSKQVGWTGVTHSDLVNWFGEEKYYPQINKWFSKKYNLEVI